MCSLRRALKPGGTVKTKLEGPEALGTSSASPNNARFTIENHPVEGLVAELMYAEVSDAKRGEYEW